MPLEKMHASAMRIVSLALVTLAFAFTGCSCEEPASEPASKEPAAARTTESAVPAPPPRPAEPDRVPLRTPRPAPSPDASPADQLRFDAGLPSFYPGDAPQYPGSTTSQSGQLPNGEVTVMFGSEDDLDEVVAFLADDLIDQGWQTEGTAEVPDGVLIEGNKGGRKIAVMVRRIGEGRPEAITMIAVVVSP